MPTCTLVNKFKDSETIVPRISSRFLKRFALTLNTEAAGSGHFDAVELLTHHGADFDPWVLDDSHGGRKGLGGLGFMAWDLGFWGLKSLPR